MLSLIFFIDNIKTVFFYIDNKPICYNIYKEDTRSIHDRYIEIGKNHLKVFHVIYIKHINTRAGHVNKKNEINHTEKH